MRQERMWVRPAFKKRMKREALNRDISVLELTEIYSKEEGELLKRRNGKKFRFRI